jgi:hypothetical protein
LAIPLSHRLSPSPALARSDAGPARGLGAPRPPGQPRVGEALPDAGPGELELLLAARGELDVVAVGVAMRLRVEAGRAEEPDLPARPAGLVAGQAIVDAAFLPVGPSVPGPAPARARAARAIAGYRRFALPALLATVSRRA